MLKKYCIIEKNFKENHAGSKARIDIGKIMQDAGWQPVCVHQSREKGLFDKIRMCFVTLADWFGVARKVKGRSCLLIQYPLATYHKVNILALPFIRYLNKIKNVRVIYLIHDLDSIRFQEYAGLMRKIERDFFKNADALISHNQAMSQILKTYNIDTYITELGIFDYIIAPNNVPNLQSQLKNVIVVAGSMHYKKAGYVYKIPGVSRELEYHIYGPNYTPEKKCSRIVYQGEFSADELPAHLKGQFGLIWDGSSVNTCEGNFGEYLRYNNPHKISLYLACGLPVIIWEKAALAKFVKENNVGLLISSLNELEETVNSVSNDEYEIMKQNAISLSEKIRNGGHTLEAVERCLRIIYE
ncbi:hypothetical protein [Cuneatibacter caecimuris]|uniref:Glycosyltransferase involved in cell wall biosynthesis n=1 Tax=Cuneatibacter caecimuris TaxID=1796618 RepID=A0A4Q7P207_9FIRM|nr:hypothetical protein [Cuneatibacter caecimuris]RZS92682.1 glycosyltransferase involved in cell wall biosynthesis [Cuneatibacter caecimuris]